MAVARERFEFSLRNASNDHYIYRYDSSSPNLPTNTDICCAIGNTSDYYSCKVYAFQFQDTLQSGWLKNGNRGQIACTQAQCIGSHAGVGTHFKRAGSSKAIGCKLSLCAGIVGIVIIDKMAYSTYLHCIP